MRILLQPADPNAAAHLVGDEVRRAFDVLQAAYIKTEGGGTMTSSDGVVGVLVLTSEADAPHAIAVLADAGIKASIG